MSAIGFVQCPSARMSTGESVSVVIPAYNAAGTIARAIESAVAQTHPVLEIFVCDDGSSDDTRDVVAGLQQPAVRWLPCGRNFGPGKPRNVGAAMAQGDWLCFLDSDDSWLPTKLQKQFDAQRETGCQLIGTNAFVLREETIASQPLLRHPPARVGFEGLLHDNVIVCSSVMVSRELWLRTQGFPESREMSAVEDYACWLQCLLYTDAFILSEPLVVYSDAPGTSLRSHGVQTLWGQRALVFGHVLQLQKALGASADDLRFRTLRRHWLKAVRRHHGWRAWLSASAATPRD